MQGKLWGIHFWSIRDPRNFKSNGCVMTQYHGITELWKLRGIRRKPLAIFCTLPFCNISIV